MARPSNSHVPTPAPKASAVPSFIPDTDKRAVLFYLLGTLQGKFENANLLTELVIHETAAAPATED